MIQYVFETKPVYVYVYIYIRVESMIGQLYQVSRWKIVELLGDAGIHTRVS